MKQIKLLAVLMVLVLLCTSATNQKTTTIFIIGDSTAAKKDLSKVPSMVARRRVS